MQPTFLGKPGLIRRGIRMSPSPRLSPTVRPSWPHFLLFIYCASCGSFYPTFPDHTSNIFMFAFVIYMFAVVLNTVSSQVSLAPSSPPTPRKSQRQIHLTLLKCVFMMSMHPELGGNGSVFHWTQQLESETCAVMLWLTGTIPCSGDTNRNKLPMYSRQFLSKSQMHLCFDSTALLLEMYLHACIFTYAHSHRCKEMNAKSHSLQWHF